LVLEDYVQAVEAAQTRRDRLTAQIETMLPEWTLAPVVAALQTMRGMALVNAASLIAELGDLSRFPNPRQLMAYLGLVPSEHSSGTSLRRGGLTKTGNSAARRLLIEAAWCYRFPARVSRELLRRQEQQPKPIRDIAWKAQIRLCARYRKLTRTGKPANVVTAAIARELSGFVWAIAVACRRRQAERDQRLITAKGGASQPTDMLLGRAGDAAAVRRTLATTICRAMGPMLVARPRQLRDASPVMRFPSAHQSMINRRFGRVWKLVEIAVGGDLQRGCYRLMRLDQGFARQGRHSGSSSRRLSAA
jgi:transposase